MKRIERTRSNDTWLFTIKILGVAAGAVIFLFMTFKTISGSDHADQTILEMVKANQQAIIRNQDQILIEIRGGGERGK